MNDQKPARHHAFPWRRPRAWFYQMWAEMDSFLHEQFDPTWREPLPPVPCQFCGRTDHKTKHCPNAKDMGF